MALRPKAQVIEVAVDEDGDELVDMLWNPYWLTYHGQPPLQLRDLAAQYRQSKIQREDLPDGVYPSGLLRYEKWFRQKRMMGKPLSGDDSATEE